MSQATAAPTFDLKREDVEMARGWADFYRSRGWLPLPSRPDDKRPFCCYRDWWNGGDIPTDLFDKWPTTNIQCMLGRHWRLLVIDLDGLEARERWEKLGRAPKTWITHSGGNGHHWWFRLPADYPNPLPKVFLWKGEEHHSAIERLCDYSLVMAPPSIHPKTGKRYTFLDRHSPRDIPLPADCPGWLLRLSPVEPDRRVCVPQVRVPTRPATVEGAARRDWREVLAAIPCKVSLAASWGVRFNGRQSPSGWVPCHAIDRDDEHPSAAVHAETGRYVDLGSGLRLSLFDMAVALGVYADFREAVDQLGELYRVRSSEDRRIGVRGARRPVSDRAGHQHAAPRGYPDGHR